MTYERWAELADREAVGDALTAEEREFIRSYAEGTAEARVELELWQRLSHDAHEQDELRERALVARVLSEVQGAEKPLSRRFSRTAAWTFGAVAAAAAVALFVFGQQGAGTPHEGRTVATAVWGSGEGSIDGAPSVAIRSVEEGRSLRITEGTLCFELQPKIHACLSENSELVFSALSGPHRHVELRSGRVAVALDPQPATERFSVVASGVWSTAIGTAFTVEMDDAGVVRTAVYEGKVLVGEDASHGEIVSRHKLGLGTASGVRVEDREQPSDRGPEWAALEQVRGTRYPDVEALEAPVEDVVPSVGELEAEREAETAAPLPPPRAPGRAQSESAEQLLQGARDLRRNQDWVRTAAAYRDLLRRFPNAPEAHAARVSLAELELSYLGDAAGALRSFEAYLETGGPLAVEAGLGRVRALRKLGNDAAEARAIADFLVRHPAHGEAARLRARLKDLSGR